MDTANYEIIAPNRKAYDTSTDWNDAVDKAVVLSLRWGVLFRIRHTESGHMPFQHERFKVLEYSLEYLELARKWPKSVSTAKAKIRFEAAKRKLDTLMESYSELKGSDLEERHALSHPIKAFRTDN